MKPIDCRPRLWAELGTECAWWLYLLVRHGGVWVLLGLLAGLAIIGSIGE